MTNLPAQTACLRLARYAPQGVPAADCFERSTEPLRALRPGEVLVGVEWLSMDPFPRLCMRGEPSGPPQLPLGSVMMGRGAGRVLASAHDSFQPGDAVAGELGWRETALVHADALRRVDPALGPLESSLGVLGPSGLTAFFVTTQHAQIRAGDTVVVSAAAGSVGLVACQIALRAGARVVAVGAGAEQVRYLKDALGVTAAIDGLDLSSLPAALDLACPEGVDVFLDGVGGALHDAVLARTNVHARVVVYGLVSSYGQAADQFDQGPRRLMHLIQRRVSLRGFLLADHSQTFDTALQTLAARLQDGSLRSVQTVSPGLDAAPAAFAALFGAAQPGKQLVRLGQPTPFPHNPETP